MLRGLFLTASGGRNGTDRIRAVERSRGETAYSVQERDQAFGDFVAIDNQSFDIYEQEFFALLGPSGCGKTTLMRMLGGVRDPTEGTILLNGQDIAPIPPNKRAVNMMFQSYALFPHLNIWENIAFGLKRDRMPKDQIDARVAEMLKLTRLEKFAKRKPHQCSGGQRQRVALARSLGQGAETSAAGRTFGRA